MCSVGGGQTRSNSKKSKYEWAGLGGASDVWGGVEMYCGVVGSYLDEQDVIGRDKRLCLARCGKLGLRPDDDGDGSAAGHIVRDAEGALRWLTLGGCGRWV